MGDVLNFNSTASYNLKIREELYIRNLKTIKYSIETIFSGPENWTIAPQNTNNCTSLRKYIRKWTTACSCHLFKYFLQHVCLI